MSNHRRPGGRFLQPPNGHLLHSPQVPQQVRVVSVQFDGRVFNFPEQIVGLMGAIVLDMGRRARLGDESARMAMKAFGVALKDKEGVAYWPLEEAAEAKPAADSIS